MTPRVTDALTLGPLTVQDRPAEAWAPVSPRARPRGHSLHVCTAAPWRDPSALPKSEAAQHPSVSAGAQQSTCRPKAPFRVGPWACPK